jgi:hypothetical protein
LLAPDLEPEGIVFDWLFEGRTSVYIVLGAVAVLLIILWRQYRNRRLLYVAAGVVALMGVYWLLDRLVETDRKTIDRTVRQMTGAVAAKKLDLAFNHISERFRSPMKRSKQEFRGLAEAEMASGHVTAVDVWPCEFPDRPDRNGETKVLFPFKLRGNLGGREALMYTCEAVFVYESPGIWRLLRCRIMHPMNDEEVPLEF